MELKTSSEIFLLYTSFMDNDPHSQTTPEKVTLDDNARKFTCETLQPEFLDQNSASSFTLVTDWLETGEDNEKKIAWKKFDNGDIQILLISKVTKDGKRTSEKQEITQELYEVLIASSILHLEKLRHEFTYDQGGVVFSLKYDNFGESNPRILEVDASSDEERSSFDPNIFPARLTEVTGDMTYYGYRMTGRLG